MTGLTLQHQLSGEDLFAPSKFWLEPNAGSQDDQEAVMDRLEDMGESSDKKAGRIHRDQHGQWTRAKNETPLNEVPYDSDVSMEEGNSFLSINQSSNSDNENSSANNSHMTGSSTSFMGAGLSRPPDEEIINMSLVLLLEGLCMHDPELRGKVGWYPIRKPFSVTQAGVKVMTARTDGCLQLIHPDKLDEDSPSLAILEAKADLRTKDSSPVYLQEGAEMAAWISSEPNHGLLHGSQEAGIYRRVLISQNFNQVFVTIAEYDEDYIHYITGHGTATRLSSGSPTQNLSSKQTSNKLSAKRGSPDLSDRESPDWGPSPPAREISHFQPGTTPSPKEDLSHLIQNAPVKNKGDTLDRYEYDYTKGFLVMQKFKGFKITDRKEVEELMILLVSLVRELYHGSQWNTRL
ncbi:uncharacterized protein TRIVIDRAFT_209104 [Trichoderma virens Gv29-8]|uniref:Uncharacterized protein n=1 Tax=Hypocrea virens (strain Gv29-8 / FGSC 10586) TaxID=413071 RepID=G9MTC9_HYPVG|nr:uncharacterized protein TRIVIDRAFT_209104 [Trichoderma virens Gv29-8]EHK22329.1 hypothetical protein TRIVIDRAFT_209104 [Trichoderma virens Gv29-8]UKZ47368.1 hypothetical protein TrVGV298_001586 [Trichoderma virens]